MDCCDCIEMLESLEDVLMTCDREKDKGFLFLQAVQRNFILTIMICFGADQVLHHLMQWCLWIIFNVGL